MTRPVNTRRAGTSAAVLMAATALTGCAASVNAGSPSTSCSPSFNPGNQYGNLSVQQRASGSSLQWGFYPSVAVSTYKVNVYMGSRRVDSKTRSYPPHASVRSVDVRSVDVRAGATFAIRGNATNPDGDILTFGLQCRA